MTRQLDFGSVLPGFAETADPRLIDTQGHDYRTLVAELRDACRDVADRLGSKFVAAQLGRKRAVVSQALAGTNGHHVHLQDLPWLIANDSTGRILDILQSMVEQAPSAEELAKAHETAASTYLSERQRPEYMRCVRAALLEERRARRVK